MRMRGPILLIVLTLTGCAAGTAPPSLLPRAAEAIDPRVPVERPMNARPADPQLLQRLAALLGEALAGDAQFEPAAANAERLAQAAGPQKESWVVAEQALSRGGRGPSADDPGAGRHRRAGRERIGRNSAGSPPPISPRSKGRVNRSGRSIAATPSASPRSSGGWACSRQPICISPRSGGRRRAHGRSARRSQPARLNAIRVSRTSASRSPAPAAAAASIIAYSPLTW